MSCCALKPTLESCRNWSCLDSPYCHSHRNVTPAQINERWFRRFVLGLKGFPVFSYQPYGSKTQIREDLSSGRITITKENINKIPPRDRYIDIFVLLCQYGYAKPEEHSSLLAMCFTYFFHTKSIVNVNDQAIYRSPVVDEIEKTLILANYSTLITFLLVMPHVVKKRPSYTDSVVRYIPSLLDSDAAKEASWLSRGALDLVRVNYVKELGEDHLLTKCLVQRWLLDIKELYQTEKAIQKMKMDHCKEELMMNRWHPSRMERWLDMGIEPDDM